MTIKLAFVCVLPLLLGTSAFAQKVAPGGSHSGFLVSFDASEMSPSSQIATNAPRQSPIIEQSLTAAVPQLSLHPLTTPAGQNVAEQLPTRPPSDTAGPGPSVRSTPATQTVIVQGIGKDVESAAKNAAENALTQVAGTFIQSDKIFNKRTEINKGIRQQTSSIETKTRDYSQGSIKSFELLESAEDNGLFRVTARVEVRIEDFKAFVAKLAEGEPPVDPGPKGQVDTQRKNKRNARDIIVDSVLVPISEGKATEFHLGKPQIYSEWERGLPAQGVKSARSLMSSWRAPPETIVVPVEMKINPAFLQNVRQTLDSIAFSAKKVDFSHLSGCATELTTPDFSATGVALAISDNASLTSVWFLKGVRFENAGGDYDRNSLSDVIKNNGGFFRHAGFSQQLLRLFPSLSVSLLGSDGIIKEYLITRQHNRTSPDYQAFY